MQPSNKKKSVSVKDKLDGNAIDLSLLELTDAPVRELVGFHGYLNFKDFKHSLN